MATFTFNMPDVGEGVAEAEIVEWPVKIRDRVEEDQPLVDVMTDQATIDIESPVDGPVVEVAGDLGDTIAVGSVLLVVEVEGEAAEEAPAPEAAPAPVEEAAPEPAPAPTPAPAPAPGSPDRDGRHTSELQSPVPNSYAVFCLKKKTTTITN